MIVEVLFYRSLYDDSVAMLRSCRVSSLCDLSEVLWFGIDEMLRFFSEDCAGTLDV